MTQGTQTPHPHPAPCFERSLMGMSASRQTYRGPQSGDQALTDLVPFHPPKKRWRVHPFGETEARRGLRRQGSRAPGVPAARPAVARPPQGEEREPLLKRPDVATGLGGGDPGGDPPVPSPSTSNSSEIRSLFHGNKLQPGGVFPRGRSRRRLLSSCSFLPPWLGACTDERAGGAPGRAGRGAGPELERGVGGAARADGPAPVCACAAKSGMLHCYASKRLLVDGLFVVTPRSPALSRLRHQKNLK